MLPHKLTLCLFLILLSSSSILAQQRKPPVGGRLAIVVDERLAALRATPQLSGRLVRRLNRGRLVAVRSMKTNADGISFFLVNVSSRTHGWIQRDAVVSPSRPGDDQSLFTLIERTNLSGPLSAFAATSGGFVVTRQHRRRTRRKTLQRCCSSTERRPRRRSGVQLFPQLHRARSLQPTGNNVRL